MLWGLGTSFLLIFAFLVQNWQRARLTEVKELKPNCLLTRHPLVFISGKRSLFYFLAYWNEIPHWLASHGYEVFHLPLPWKNSRKRKQSLQNFLTQKSASGERFHLFLDQSSYNIVKALLQSQDFSCLASVTLIGKETSTEAALAPQSTMPIEELELPSSDHKKPVFWLLHLLWTSQSLSLSQLGWKMARSQGDYLLERIQFLAERDLLQKQRSPRLES